VIECDGEVTGTLTIAGQDFDLEGMVDGDLFSWHTNTLDLCDTQNIRRSLYSNSRAEFVVDDEGDSFTGSFRLVDGSCSSGRAYSRGYTTTFD
jgi:hypothetical protein